MDDKDNFEWESIFCSGGDHDLWCVTHLKNPMLVAVVRDWMFDRKRVPRAVSTANIVWVTGSPGRNQSLVLRTQAMRVIREAREEYHRALGKGWHPRFIIGSCFSTTLTGPGNQPPPGPCILASPRPRRW